MKQKLKRFMAGFMAMLTLVGTLFTNGTTAFAASPQANIAFWNASVKNSGEVSELKPGYNHGKILYSILDGNSAYCMNCYSQGWWKNWVKNGWLNSKKQPVANKVLWTYLIPYFESDIFNFYKVKGHDDDYWNNYVDRRAVEAKEFND